MNKVQQKYSTFPRELLTIYLVINHSSQLREGRNFIIDSDHKPYKMPGTNTHRENYISQFTSGIRHKRSFGSLSRSDIQPRSDSDF